MEDIPVTKLPKVDVNVRREGDPDFTDIFRWKFNCMVGLNPEMVDRCGDIIRSKKYEDILMAQTGELILKILLNFDEYESRFDAEQEERGSP